MAARRNKLTGTFITLEGIEGSGKTTQAARLTHVLTRTGYQVLHTREPGGTPIAERIRAVLLDSSTEPLAPEAEVFLILAARRQHVDQVIMPALQRGMTVVCDRFVDSTLAYQGYGRGLDVERLCMMNEWVAGSLLPDLTLLFDVPVTIGLRRRTKEAGAQNRIDRETQQFHQKVRSGFLHLARRDPRRIKLVDATPSRESVGNATKQLVASWLDTHRSAKRRRR